MHFFGIGISYFPIIKHLIQLLLACMKASILESEALKNLFIPVFKNIDTFAVHYLFHLTGNFVFVFVYIKKCKLQTKD